jgi:hypothetical protein
VPIIEGMPAPFLLVASLVAFSDERLVPPAAPHEQCLELRQFRGGERGGCRVAIDQSLAWICMTEGQGADGKDSYGVRLKSAQGDLVKELSYDRRRTESWGEHVEIFYTSADAKKNPDLRIGFAQASDSTVVVGRSRYCMPAESAKSLKR